MSSSHRISLNNWLAQLDVKADTVFDIGGSQEALKPRVKSWDVKELLVFDLEQPHAESPKPDVICDLNVWNQHLNAYKGLGDIIFCLEVFDYVYDPVNAMQIIRDLMKNHGTAYISFPSQYPLHQPVEDDALRYMPGAIKKLAAKVGMEIVEMIPRRTETDAIYNAFRVERMRCAKHEDHNFTGFIVEFTR